MPISTPPLPDDDHLWIQLRSDAAAPELPATAQDRIRRRARRRLARRPHHLREIRRALEAAAVVALVLAQLAWAWITVLG